MSVLKQSSRGEASVAAYALAHIRSVQMGPEITKYLERIDATLEPFGGRFLVHGNNAEILEGEWRGDVIIIEFPDRDSATRWYESAAYQAILPFRTRYSDGTVILVDGVPQGHHATDLLVPSSAACPSNTA
jgi:uncharacterized protein (DUF1330 family)